MRRIAADLHIHTCLSPCAELEMTPRGIIERARQERLDMIAIADHNTARNVAVVMELGREAGITVLPAMEITTREEVHVLAYFGGLSDALIMQERVYETLQMGGGRDDPETRWQVVVNGRDEVLGFEKRRLMGATDISLGTLVAAIRDSGGLAVASHVDRASFSVTSQMGFVPPEVRFDAFEVLDPVVASKMLKASGARGPLIMSSDSHHLADVGRRRTALMVEGPGFEEFALALGRQAGRLIASPAQ